MGNQPKYKALRGMEDILPEEAYIFRWVENKSRDIFHRFGFKEIRTPLLEDTEIFIRSIGEDTDIVEKEMYTFEDRGGKSVSLRPEGTASIVRAYLEHGWQNTEDIAKLYYFGPMFRGERPQKGRLRQFHQIGAEIIGGRGPFVDAELILNLNALLKGLGIDGFTLYMNSLGCISDRASYQEILLAYLMGRKEGLCDDCKRRMDKNVLRVLDCKKEACRIVVKDAPAISDHLCESCGEDYRTLAGLLSEMGVNFKVKKDLVRGLDYYTGTIFEVNHPALGAQDAIAAGGRYDSLINDMGGPDTGATGYAVGVERLMLAIERDKLPREENVAILIPIGFGAKIYAFHCVEKLRDRGICCEIDLSGRSVKGQLRKAHKEGRRFVILIGEEEMKSGKVLLKDMLGGIQETLGMDEAADRLKS